MSRPPGVIQNLGPAEVVRRLFRLKANATPGEVEWAVRPVAEVRAQRPWEFFHERLTRWRVHGERAATVNVFVGFSVDDISVTEAPTGTLLVVDEITNAHETDNVDVRIGALALGSASLERFAVDLDRRVGEVTLFAGPRRVPIGFFETQGAITPTAPIALQIPPGHTVKVGYVRTRFAEQPTIQTLQCVSRTAADGITPRLEGVNVSLSGYLIIPEEGQA